MGPLLEKIGRVPAVFSPISGAATLTRIAFQELANDSADAATLARGPRGRAAMQILRDTNGDPGRVNPWCVAERRSARSRRPGLEVKVLFEARRQALDIGLGEAPATFRDHRSCHLITRS